MEEPKYLGTVIRADFIGVRTLYVYVNEQWIDTYSGMATAWGKLENVTIERTGYRGE